MSKSKNANRLLLIIYTCTSTKMSYVSVFLSRIMQNSEKGWTRHQNIDSYDEISFLGKGQDMQFLSKTKMIS